MLKTKLLIASLLVTGVLTAQEQNFNNFIEVSTKNFITYKSNSLLSAQNLIKNYPIEIGMNRGDALQLLKQEEDQLGFTHSRYQQFHQGVEVYGAQYLMHEKGQQLRSSNGKLVGGITASESPSISSKTAVLNAISHVGAAVYMWEDAGAEQILKRVKNDPFASYYPVAELVYMDPYFTQVGKNYQLVYKVEVYAKQPLSKQDVFVHAQSGMVIHAYNKIHTAEVTGVAATKYSGTQSIQTDSVNATSFRLREYARGGGIETYNMLTGTNYTAATDFIDGDNNWNNVNAQQDEAATDAHWAAEMTYDYFLNQHGRNSFDNAGTILLSYVHYDANYNNAFWDGIKMTYGDGDGTNNTALTSLDVGGHEMTHGVTEYSANLVYQNESGALNESFSDIFGATIEFYKDSLNADWFIGEDFDINGNGFRSMSDPNIEGDPDTYLGVNWATGPGDNGGVHTNSGVQNYWYHLLAVGGSGTNDNNDAYSVNGIGLDSAAAIAYRNLTVYLTPSSTYQDARNGAILSAKDLYGNCSFAMVETSKAWAAVGVGFAIEDNDLTLLSIDAPATGCGLGNAETVTIKIRNNGCAVNLLTGATIPVSFQVDGGSVVSETITLASNFNAGDTLTYTFTGTANIMTIGMHNISSWVKYGSDNQALNDSLMNVQIENKLQQNIDVALIELLSPLSGCHLSNSETVQVAIQFLGCDSLVAGTNINVAYQINGGAVVNETLTLAATIYAEDTVTYSFSAGADLSNNGNYNLNAWTAFTIDTINNNDTINNHAVQHPSALFANAWVGFEGQNTVLDSMILSDGVEAKASITATSAYYGTYSLQMTGGDPLSAPALPDLDTANFWLNNLEYASFAKICVDGSAWSSGAMYFDLRQTMSSVYNFQFGQPVPQASSLRVVVNGTQIGGTYNPYTETADTFATHAVDLNAYAGTQFEVVFEARMGFNKASDPLGLLGSEGDNAFIDNIRFSEFGVSVEEHEQLETFTVYPNPNDGAFTILFNSNSNQSIVISVFSVLGSELTVTNKKVVSGKNNINMNISSLSKGIYLVKVSTENKTQVSRMVKN